MPNDRTPGRVFTPADCPPYVSVADFAASFDCSPSGVTEAIRAGTLAARELSPRIIRIPRSELFPELAAPALTFDDRIVQRAAGSGLESTRALLRAVEELADRAREAQRHLEQIETVVDAKATRATERRAA